MTLLSSQSTAAARSLAIDPPEALKTFLWTGRDFHTRHRSQVWVRGFYAVSFVLVSFREISRKLLSFPSFCRHLRNMRRGRGGALSGRPRLCRCLSRTESDLNASCLWLHPRREVKHKRLKDLTSSEINKGLGVEGRGFVFIGFSR